MRISGSILRLGLAITGGLKIGLSTCHSFSRERTAHEVDVIIEAEQKAEIQASSTEF